MKVGELLHRLRGFSTPWGGFSWAAQPSEREIAQRLMIFLYDRRVLYAPSEAEMPDHVVRSVMDIRREITDCAKQLTSGGRLELELRAMRGVCLHFLNRIGKHDELLKSGAHIGHWASWEFLDALGQWRAFMAVYLGTIAAAYQIDPPAFLSSILPQIPEAEAEDESDSTEENLGALIDEFAALPRAEKRRQIDALNSYLASPEGQREFGTLSKAVTPEDDQISSGDRP